MSPTDQAGRWAVPCLYLELAGWLIGTVLPQALKGG